MKLSTSARSLWAKTAQDGEAWLALYAHMSDSAEIAKRLWRNWVPRGTKNSIVRDIPCSEKTFIFLAAYHDIGKATPAFQLGKQHKTPALLLAEERVAAAGFLYGTMRDTGKVQHATASEIIAEKRHRVSRELGVVLGGHHGMPPSDTDLNRAQSYGNNLGFSDAKWTDAQDELFEYALRLADIDRTELAQVGASNPTQMLLTGLVIMADWIASDEALFPYIDAFEPLETPEVRAERAWDGLDLPPCWEPADEDTLARFDIVKERFGFDSRPIQDAAARAAASTAEPGIVVIEAPMGEGKTEAALAAAEILAAKTGRGGVFFALPTQATSDGMFPRITDWIGQINPKSAGGEPRTITLAHGKSHLNELYEGIKSSRPNIGDGEENEHDSVTVLDWFSGRKKGLLADFAVGTVDHLLMGGLRQKHLALRHLGLANKVVIIDECHAYDAYMNSYLFKALNWLGAYRTPVVILSATLPSDTRRKLVGAYLNRDFSAPVRSVPRWSDTAEPAVLPEWATSREYPLIIFSDGGDVRSVTVTPSDRRIEIDIAALSDDALADTLDELLTGGGCAGVIVNTVGRAQAIARSLSERFSDEIVSLLHARFIASDRVAKETVLRDALGRDGANRPKKLIVVGTQVIEQSLDLDFDVLVTDLCPMDLLLQRTGRLHRHLRARPERLANAACYVLGADGDFERGSASVYGAYALMNTRALLPESVTLPDDIPELVQRAYAPGGLGLPGEDYAAARAAHQKLIVEKQQRANAFQIGVPQNLLSLTGAFETPAIEDRSGKRAEAAVRDAGDSIEVIVILRRGDERYYTLPFLKGIGGTEIPREMPAKTFAAAIASCTVRLPPVLTSPCMIDRVIRELENGNRSLPIDWQRSPMLRDELFLVLDEGYSASISGYTLRYDERYGLFSEKSGTQDKE
ncbi:MAG: CRISPR-associated helicase Cas3' [Oscillospiraceae bacterium]|nr:CRISPR-associated helicase Cas3' [Oscillospiraceae bacterium]